jgi:hypothetical protein
LLYGLLRNSWLDCFCRLFRSVATLTPKIAD